jgi:peptidoglycan pentaglycine glycine transferase (the first glycine)
VIRDAGIGPLKAVIELRDPGEQWDAFVASHSAGHLMQSRAWARVRKETGWEPIFLSLADNGAIRAACLCLRLRLPGTGACLIYLPRGPVLDYHDNGVVTAFAAALRHLAEGHGAFLVQADPAVASDDEDSHPALQRMGFQRQEKHGIFRILQPRWVMRIPLERYGGSEGWVASLDRKVRYNMRLPERRGIKVMTRSDHEACVAFHRLLWETGRAKGFPVRRFKYHEAIWRHCVQAGLGEYLFAAHEGQTLAAIQLLRFGPTCWYMYGASTRYEQQLRSSYLLHREGVRRAWAAGCHFYDMGGIYSPEPKPDDPEYGLYAFKRQFNAELVRYLGEYDLVLRPVSYAVWRGLETLAQRPASWVFRLRHLLAGSA